MNDTTRLLDRLSQKLGDASDYRISQALGVTRASVSRWRLGKGSFSDAAALKVAEMLDENPGYVLAVAAAERAQSEQERKAWAKVAQTMRRSAAAVAALAVLGFGMPQGATTPARIPSSSQCILCYIRRMASFLRPVTALASPA